MATGQIVLKDIILNLLSIDFDEAWNVYRLMALQGDWAPISTSYMVGRDVRQRWDENYRLLKDEIEGPNDNTIDEFDDHDEVDDDEFHRDYEEYNIDYKKNEEKSFDEKEEVEASVDLQYQHDQVPLEEDARMNPNYLDHQLRN